MTRLPGLNHSRSEIYHLLRVVAPLSGLSRRTRLYKLANFAHYIKSMNIVMVGWERMAGEGEEIYLDFPIVKTYALHGGGYGGSAVRARYALWMLSIFFRALRFRRGELVWALGFESAFPAVLASKLRGFRVVFDDADRFSLLFPLPSPVRRVIAALERWTSRRATVHVIPGPARYDFASPRFFVLRNTPSDRELQAAKALFAKMQWPTARLVINVNGWLGTGRGMAQVLELARRLDPGAVAFLVAGKLGCPAAKDLVGLPNVHYLGEVSNATALAAYYASDYVFTYYKPDSTINRFAESNKWGDALKTGIGIIVNSEVATAAPLVQAGAAISVPYDRVDLLVAQIRTVLADPAITEAHKASSTSLAAAVGTYEDQLGRLFHKLEDRSDRQEEN